MRGPKLRSVLSLVASEEGATHVVFEGSEGNTLLTVERVRWEAFGEPSVVTVSIEAGDAGAADEDTLSPEAAFGGVPVPGAYQFPSPAMDPANKYTPGQFPGNETGGQG